MKRASRLSLAFLLGLGGAVPAALPVLAQQQGQQWFVPGQGQQGQQQRPPQAQPQRPAQQRPAQPNPAPLAPGQPTPAPVIGLVDIEEVQRSSTAFGQVREELERRRARLNEDLQREQQRWREEQQALAAARATLPPEQLRTRERELQERIADAQRIFRDRNRNLEQAAQQGLGEIQQALGVVLQQVAASRNVNLVLPRQVVVFNLPGFDLTEQVTAQLNTVLRSVTLPADGAAPAAAAPATPPAPPPAAPAAPPRR
jgi:Skp family chaperone for outer membrane proteins